MAEQPPEEIYLKHERAADYKEISADGTLHKIVDSHLIITFYIEDSRVTGEVLKREDRASGQPTYRIAAIEEEKQRLDLDGGPRARQGHPRPCRGGGRAHDPRRQRQRAPRRFWPQSDDSRLKRAWAGSIGHTHPLFSVTNL